jgi:hypothetical protein
MKPSELLRNLHEANKRLQYKLEELGLRNAELTARQYAELRWLAKDDDDAMLGGASRDWTK